MPIWHRQLVGWTLVLFAIFAANDQAGAQNGVLSLTLEAPGPDGAVYRLRDALFLIRGSTSAFVLATEEEPAPEAFSLDLQGGSYSIELMPGWRMERSMDAETQDVDARLASDNLQSFVIRPAETIQVTYNFLVSNVEPGSLQLGLAVEFAPLDDDTDEISSCDPVAQTGCTAGEKCTAVVSEQDGSLRRTTCVANGNRLEGQQCTSDPDNGFDNCVAGLFCVQGTCQPVCEVGADVPGCFCSQFAGVFDDREGVGVCQPTCNVLAQDCPSGENCYLKPTAAQSFCAAPAAEVGRQGDPCNFVNSCDTGHACVLPDQTATHLQCAFMCDATGGPPSCADGPGSEFTCVQMNEFFADVDGVEDRIGLCVDCSQFPTHAACNN
jgi:hypothetical protein